MNSYDEAKELICLIAGIKEDDIDEKIESDFAKEYVGENFGIDVDTFVNILDVLIDFVPPIKAGLSGTIFKAFVHDHRMIFRKEIANKQEGE